MTDDLDMALDTPHKIGTQVADEMTATLQSLNARLRTDRMWLLGDHKQLILELERLTETYGLVKLASEGACKLDSYSGKTELEVLKEQLAKAQQEVKRLKDIFFACCIKGHEVRIPLGAVR